MVRPRGSAITWSGRAFRRRGTAARGAVSFLLPDTGNNRLVCRRSTAVSRFGSRGGAGLLRLAAFQRAHYVPEFRDNEIDWEVLPKLTSEDLTGAKRLSAMAKQEVRREGSRSGSIQGSGQGGCNLLRYRSSLAQRSVPDDDHRFPGPRL